MCLFTFFYNMTSVPKIWITGGGGTLRCLLGNPQVPPGKLEEGVDSDCPESAHVYPPVHMQRKIRKCSSPSHQEC